jgi:long-chain-fatty-acid--CoA ligase ACSBG
VQSEVDKETTEPLDKLSASTFDWMHTAGCPTTCLTVSDFIAACSDVTSAGGKELRAAIQAGIDKANRSAPSRAQTIQKWTILPRDFSVVGGELGKSDMR